MPANRANYIVLYTTDSQIYAASSKEVALATEPPAGADINDKRIFFITYEPDNEILSVHPIPLEEIRSAEIIKRKPTKKKNVQEENNSEG